MSSGSFQNVICKMNLEIIYLIYIYKKDFALNDLQWLICHKTKVNQAKSLCIVLNFVTFSYDIIVFVCINEFIVGFLF